MNPSMNLINETYSYMREEPKILSHFCIMMTIRKSFFQFMIVISISNGMVDFFFFLKKKKKKKFYCTILCCCFSLRVMIWQVVLWGIMSSYHYSFFSVITYVLLVASLKRNVKGSHIKRNIELK